MAAPLLEFVHQDAHFAEGPRTLRQPLEMRARHLGGRQINPLLVEITKSLDALIVG